MRSSAFTQTQISGKTSLLSAPGAVQMAIDAYLATRVVNPNGALFRLFRMSPPAVTIGRHQRWRRVIDEAACVAQGWDWARRPTGGGALLHKNEINYTVVVPRGQLTPRGTGEFSAVFECIGRALAKSLFDMGFDPQLHVGGHAGTQPQHGLCGRSITGYEIVHDGRKIIAAAQLITPDSILQHGTIYLKAPGSLDRFWPQTLSPESQAGFGQDWSAIDSVLTGRSLEESAVHIEQGFKSHFPLPTCPCQPGPTDWRAIDAILGDWTERNWDHSR